MRPDLDDERLDVLKDELIAAQELAVDKDGKMLVWTGDGATPPQAEPTSSQLQSPATYTPQHLAERIRAEQQAMESRGAADGERKTITALFADLKGSTAPRLAVTFSRPVRVSAYTVSAPV